MAKLEIDIGNDPCNAVPLLKIGDQIITIGPELQINQQNNLVIMVQEGVMCTLMAAQGTNCIKIYKDGKQIERFDSPGQATLEFTV